MPRFRLPKFSQGTAALTLARLLVLSLSGASTALVARLLGTSSYGQYVQATAIATLSVVLGPVGQDQLFQRGQVNPEDYITRTWQAVVGSFGLLLAVSLLWPNLLWEIRFCTILLGTGLLARLIVGVELAQLSKQQLFRRRAVRELTSIGLIPAVSLCLFLALPRYPIFCAASTLAASLAVALPRAITAARPRWRTLLRSDPRKEFRLGLPIAISAAMWTLYLQGDLAILSSLRTHQETALYAVAAYCLTVSLVPSTVMSNEVMRMRIYGALEAGQDANAVRTIAKASLRQSVVVALTIAGALVLIAPKLIPIIFGGAYRDSGRFLPWLALAALAYYIANWGSNILYGFRRPGSVAVVQGVLCGFNLSMNLLLVPKFGALACAVLTATTELLGLCFFVYMGVRQLKLGKLPEYA